MEDNHNTIGVARSRPIPAAIDRRIDEVIARLRADRRLTVCSSQHVRSSPMVFACAQHPGAGLSCYECAKTHILRHDPDDEHRCDQCGTVVRDDGLYSAAQVCDVTVEARDRRGRRGIVVGTVAVVGLGACAACVEAEEVTR